MEWKNYKFYYDKQIICGNFNNAIIVGTDNKSALFLEHITLDYEDGLNGSGFIWNNPNAKRTCGCGSSFSPNEVEE